MIKNSGLLFVFFLLLASCGVKKKSSEFAMPSKADYPYIEKFHEAVRLKQRGQFNDAIKSFEACLNMRQNDDAVYYALSQLYLQTQQLSKSAEAIQKAAKLDPKNVWYVQELAYMQFEAKNYTEAAKNFKALVAKEPQNVDWLFSYAESLVRAGDSQGAIKALDKLQDQVGVNPELSIEKFRLYRQVKQDEKALNELQAALKVFPKDAQLIANLVDYYFEKKQSDKAFEYLQKLAEVDPQNGNAHLALAQFYDQKGERKKSYEELFLVFKAPDLPLDQKMKIMISLFDSQTTLDPEMLELAAVLVDTYPSEAKVYTIQGDCFLKMNKSKEALKAFKTALTYEKTKYVVWEQVMFMEYENKDYASLYETSTACLSYFALQSKAYLFQAISANQLKKHQEALAATEQGVELSSSDNALKSEFFAQQGEAYFGLKKYNEGKNSYESSLKLTPSNVLVKNNYAYRLATAKVDLSRAETLIKEVLQNNSNESHFLDTYAWILFQQEKYSEAKKYILQAYELKPNDKIIVEHMGDVLFKEGKINEALNFWKEAKKLGSSNQLLDKKIEQKNYYEPIY